jgi:pyridoxine 4-dehydrogenase
MTENMTPNAAAAGTITIGGDLPVRRLGFGAMRITGEGIWGDPPDREAAHAVLRRTVELGVNFIDTADAYGPNVSEELIAEALHPYPAGLVIATKGGLERTGPGKWSSNGRPDHLREACDGSLRRLRVDVIDVYQLHRPDVSVPYEDSIGALVGLQQEGKVRHIGVSNVTVAQLQSARRLAEIVSVQNRYNLVDRRSDDVLALCEENSIAFLPWAPIQDLDERPALRAVADRYGADPRQIVLAWLLARSPAMLPIPGTGSARHLAENVAAAALQLSADDMAALDAA